MEPKQRDTSTRGGSGCMLAIVAVLATFFMACVDACDKLPEERQPSPPAGQEVPSP